MSGQELEGETTKVSEEVAVWAIRFFLGREPVDDAEIALHRRHPNIQSVRSAFSKTIEFKKFFGEQLLIGHGVSYEAALWAIRLFIGREPRNEEEVMFHRNHPHIDSLRAGFAQTKEFQGFLRSLSPSPAWSVPIFLLEPPKDRTIPFKFESPSIADPCSQTCTENQFAEPLYIALSKALGVTHVGLHRKAWEFVWVAAVLKKAALLRKGNRGIGFGVGQEPLPAFFASHGVEIMATDAPAAVIDGHGWDVTGQHAVGLEPLRRPHMLDNETFDRLVQFEPVDMNDIPVHMRDFDFCWSSCCFEHLGSIEHGLNFVEQSLKTLRPGGLAVHTTEFNLSSNNATFEHPTLSLFRKRDIEDLYARLIAAGHKVWPLNLHPGTGPADAHIDLPPYGRPHLKLEVASYVTTSIGLVVEKGGGS